MKENVSDEELKEIFGVIGRMIACETCPMNGECVPGCKCADMMLKYYKEEKND